MRFRESFVQEMADVEQRLLWKAARVFGKAYSAGMQKTTIAKMVAKAWKRPVPMEWIERAINTALATKKTHWGVFGWAAAATTLARAAAAEEDSYQPWATAWLAYRKARDRQWMRSRYQRIRQKNQNKEKEG